MHDRDCRGRSLVWDVAFLCFEFVQTDPGHFGVDERRPGDHRIVGVEFPEWIEQGIYRGVSGLMGSSMGELVRSGDVAGGVDVRVFRLHELLGFDCPLGRDAKFF